MSNLNTVSFFMFIIEYLFFECFILKMEIRIGDLKKSLKKIPVSFTALRNSCKLLFPGDFRINLIN